jgi:hypothetical protein
MNELGKTLLGLGLLITFVGVLLLLAGRIGLPLGRLPGDITYKGTPLWLNFKTVRSHHAVFSSATCCSAFVPRETN